MQTVHSRMHTKAGTAQMGLRRAHPLGFPSQRQHRPIIPAAAAMDRLPGKQLTNPLRLEGSHTYNVTLDQPTDPEARLGTYMQLLGKDFSALEMPLGAKLAQLSKKAYQIIAPRMQIFNIWIQPTSLATLEFGDDFIGLVARQCHLKGSSHVSNMNLDELFNLQVTMRFKYNEGDGVKNPTITSTATIAVDLEVEPLPFPFNVTPRPALEATGNTAFETTLKIMLDGYMKSLLGDYAAWSKDPELRKQRALAVAEATANVL